MMVSRLVRGVGDAGARRAMLTAAIVTAALLAACGQGGPLVLPRPPAPPPDDAPRSDNAQGRRGAGQTPISPQPATTPSGAPTATPTPAVPSR